jgi:hypothetical protein
MDSIKFFQKNDLAINIDNTESDSIILWSDLNTKDPQVIIVYRENIDSLILALQVCKNSFNSIKK